MFELHGSVWRNFCMRCKKSYTMSEIVAGEEVPRCACGGTVKPDVVLYGEMLNDEVVAGAVRAISEADTLVVGGTSLVVYPAAGLLRYFKGKHLVVVNKTPTQADAEAAHRLYQVMMARHGEEHPEAFAAKPLKKKKKREQPATKRQKEYLHDLLKCHRIDVTVQIDAMSRSEVSRMIDNIISQYGRMTSRISGEQKD